MNKIRISFVLNIVVFIMTVAATIIMFMGFKFMPGNGPVLEATSLEMFKFFTVDSNIFMGIVALLFAIYEYKYFNKKINSLPKYLYILKLMSCSGVGLTFFVVFAYLGPIYEGGIYGMLLNSNLFYHFLIPVVSIISFIFFEKNNKLNFKDSFYGLVPCLLYSVYYCTNVLLHVENGKVSPLYDWYWFIQNGIWTAFIVAPLILLISYGISFLLYKLNKSNL